MAYKSSLTHHLDFFIVLWSWRPSSSIQYKILMNLWFLDKCRIFSMKPKKCSRLFFIQNCKLACSLHECVLHKIIAYILLMQNFWKFWKNISCGCKLFPNYWYEVPLIQVQRGWLSNNTLLCRQAAMLCFLSIACMQGSLKY